MKYLLIATLLFTTFETGDLSLNKDKSTLQISGTSSLHDWVMDVESFTIKGTINESHVKDLSVSVDAHSMKSGKKIMDDKAYKAVEAKDHPRIYFKSDQLSIADGKLNGIGLLSVAGIEKEISLTAKIISHKNGEMHLSGSIPIQMSTFNIDPPTAMFGTLKTGNEIQINYEIFLFN